MATPYKSICEVRREYGLSCETCLLHGYLECLESKGTEPSVGSDIYGVDSIVPCNERSMTGYKLRLPGYDP